MFSAGDAVDDYSVSQPHRNDLARLCLRFGAIPVLAIPPDKAECPSRRALLEAAREANLPAVEVTPTDAAAQVSVADPSVPVPFPHRVAWLFGLLAQHVSDRTPANVAATSGVAETEEE